MGQAFEDAAIGYELNGIAGAVRGASNNVSFLLNDLSRIPAIQTRIGNLFKLSEKASEAIIPAASGIGAALAITVLPPMIEWLETLNDIEYEFNDLAEKIKRQFQDVDLEISVSIDEQRLERDLQKMESIRDVLERINELRLRSEEIVFEVRTQVEDILTAPSTRLFRSNLQKFSDEVQKEVDRLQRSIDQQTDIRPQAFGPGDIAFPLSDQTRFIKRFESQIGRFKEIQSLINNINQGVIGINQNAQDGILNANAIRKTRDEIAELNERLNSTSAELTKSDKITFDKATESAKALEERLNELVEPARQFESLVGEQLTSAIESIGQKTEELAAKQAILGGQLIGTSTEYDEMVLGVSEVSREYESLIASTIEFYERTGAARDRIQELRRSLEDEAAFEVGNQLLREQNDIVAKLSKAEQRLADLRDKEKGRDSRKVSLDQFATAIQETALSLNETGLDKNTTAIQDLTEEIGRLQDALFKLNQAQEAIGQDNTADVIRGIALQRTPRQMAPEVLAVAFGGIGGGLVAGLQQAQNPFAAFETARLGAANRRVALQQRDIEEIGQQFAARIRDVLKDQPIRIDKTWQPEVKAPPARLAN